jgi:hypothetical protein
MEFRRFLVTIISLIALSLAALVWFYPSSEDFRADNPFWNGLRDFTARSGASLLSSLNNLPPIPEETALIIVPYLPFSEGELQKLENYVSAGGTLLILDDYAYGNDILDYLGLEARFSEKPLLDPLFNYRNKWLPRIIDFAPTPLAEGVDSLLLNHASSLEGVSPAQTLAWSTRFSFVDSNNNSTWDEGESLGPLPVAAQLTLGEGYVFLIADPSLLINSMGEWEGNYRFVQNLAGIRNPDAPILIDQSHLPGEALDEAKGMLRTARSLISAPPVAAGLVVAALMLALKPLWHRKGGSF